MISVVDAKAQEDARINRERLARLIFVLQDAVTTFANRELVTFEAMIKTVADPPNGTAKIGAYGKFFYGGFNIEVEVRLDA